MQTGWLDDGGERYYLKGSGAMATGWREMDGAWYYFEGSGRMAKGVIDVGGLHYYMDPSTGRMAAGTTVDIGGVAYTADGNGVLSQVAQESEMRPETARQEMYRLRRRTEAREDRRPSLHRTAGYLTRRRVWARLSQVHPADRAWWSHQ